MSNEVKPIVHKPVAESQTQKFIRDFLMGGVSAGISKTIASPIEVIKMRL